LENALSEPVLFDRLLWRDPLNDVPLEPLIAVRTPAGVPIYGALRVTGTDYGYPIVDCVARLTPELAERYAEWLTPFGLQPPSCSGGPGMTFQPESTVESFGFQWTFNSAMRSETDLRWRVAERFKVQPTTFTGKLVLMLVRHETNHGLFRIKEAGGLRRLSAIEVAAKNCAYDRSGWSAGDITALPF
jgi:hypothetical protein